MRLSEWTTARNSVVALRLTYPEDTFADPLVPRKCTLPELRRSPLATTMQANPALNTTAIGQCQLCRGMRQTAPVTFHRNVGMLVARQNIVLKAALCKTCLKSKFWEFQGKGLLLGPWGMISLVVTPIYLITNTVAYASASQKLRNAVE